MEFKGSDLLENNGDSSYDEACNTSEMLRSVEIVSDVETTYREDVSRERFVGRQSKIVNLPFKLQKMERFTRGSTSLLNKIKDRMVAKTTQFQGENAQKEEKMVFEMMQSSYSIGLCFLIRNYSETEETEEEEEKKEEEEEEEKKEEEEEEKKEEEEEEEEETEEEKEEKKEEEEEKKEEEEE
ncbi:unnamed protein product [Cochlearia groenlandica]